VTYELVFEHEPPIKGRRVCLTNIGGVSSPEEAEAKARELWPGIVRFKRVVLQRRSRPEVREAAMGRPVTLPSDLTARIVSGSRKKR